MTHLPPVRRRPHVRLRPVALAAASALGLLGAPLQAAGPAPTPAPATLPTGLNVVHGQAQVATVLKGAAAQMTVHSSAGAVLNWNSFSIGAQAGVHFQQTDATSKVLNRVTGSDPSAIFGSLTSNGQVWLLNPNGVLFGAGSRVDVAGLVASTLRLSDNSFLDGLRSGRFSFGEGAAGLDGASVRNEGAIRTAHGGHLVMLSERVENTGTLDAPGGALLLAGAKAATLVDSALPYLAAVVPAGEVLNLGRAAADGGVVDVYAAVVNQQGLVRADTVAVDAQGRVVLKAADTLMLGEASRTSAAGTAEGSTGGRIDLLGTQVGLVGAATVDVSGTAGGGGIRLGGGLMGRDASVANSRAVFVGPEALLLADATGAAGMGGSIILWSDEATRAYGRFSARGGSARGDGGFVETSGGWIDARPAGIDVTTRGGVAGTWLIDPNNLTISDTGPDTNITGSPSFTTTGDGAVITTATIATALNAGNSVTLTTAAGGVQAGDILMIGASLTVSPPSGVRLRLNATRDIVIHDSSIASTGSRLFLDLYAAGGGFGVVDIYNSVVSTAGGGVFIQGQNPLPLPLPGGDARTGFSPAVSYLAGSGPASLSRSGGRVAVNVEASTIDLAGPGIVGNFAAYGLNVVENSDAVRVGSTTDMATSIRAGRVVLVGASAVATPVAVDVGVSVRGDATELLATEAIFVEGAGRAGVVLEDGARLTLNATLGASAPNTIRILGWGSDEAGIALFADDSESPTFGRGTRITANNGALELNGRRVAAGEAVRLSNGAGAPGPLIDLSAATGTTIESVVGAGYAGGRITVGPVDLMMGAGGTLAIAAADGLLMNETFVSGAGSLSLSGATVEVLNSSILSTGAPLAFSMATTGAAPRGGGLENTIIETRGGDVTFGAPGTVSSTLLGTSAPGFWLEAGAAGGDGFGVLYFLDSVVDAGSGRIRGGGAARSVAVDSSGVQIFRSVLTASSIELAGRSDSRQGLIVDESTLLASRTLSLAGDSASNSPPVAYGLQIGQRSTLQLVDPTAAAGSSFSLRGRQLTDGIGLLIEGGAVGSGNETRLAIGGAAATLSGTSGSGSGLVLRGSAAASGGAFINAAAAPSLRLEGLVTLGAATGGTGTGLQLFHARVIGPQLAASSPLDIVANGGGAGGAGLKLEFSALSSGGVTTVAGNSILVSNSLLSGDGSINLYAVDQGASAGSVVIDQSLLQTSGPTARVFVGTRAGGPALGVPGIAGGAGVLLVDSQLEASDAGGTVEVRGTGAATGGRGIEFARTPLIATTLSLVGRGSFDGDGVFSDELSAAPSTLRTANLSINGLAAHDPAATSLTRAGVVLGRGVALDLALGGTALIEGDLIVLGRSAVATGTGLLGFQAFGGPASFVVNATRSMMLREASLDFSDGSGTAITLRADTDGVDGGRVRINTDTVIRSGGGDITMEGRGSATASATSGPPRATVVLEGGTGVFLSGGTLDAGSGVITLTGRTWDFGTGATTEPSVGGVLLQEGVNSLTARRVQMDGSTVSSGFGVTIGLEGATTPQTINADEIVIRGNGVGTVSSVGLAAPGVLLFGGASLQAGTSLQLVGHSGSGVSLDTAQAVSLGSLTIDGAGPVRSIGSFVSAEGALSIVGVGSSTENGVTIATGALLGAGPLNSLTRGDSVLIRGLNSAGARGVLLQADAGIGNITTYTGAATITAGTDPRGGAVAMTGRWTLNPAGALNIESPGGLALAVGATSGLAPLFGGDAINLSIADGGTVSYGPFGSINAALFQAALPTAAVPLSLRVVGGGALEMAGSLSVAGRLRLDAEGGVGLIGPAAVVSTAPGDAIVIGGHSGASPSFVNRAGASALSAPAGRWVIFSTGPAATALGGLDPAFSAWGLGAAPWGVNGAGDLVTPLGGNALGYRLGTADVAGTVLSVSQTRAYDTTARITLDPGSWVVGGLVAGDRLSLAGSTAATTADNNVGVDKPVTPDAAAVFSITDADGRPVFGYGAPALRATITPVALTATGTAAASKVYDGTTAATLTSLGAVSPLAGDVVGVGGTVVAVFADKNAGTEKVVNVTGLALTGADAGNYTLIAPTGLLADVTPRPLAVTGVTALNKVYDTTRLATLGGTASVTALAGDTVVLAGTGSAAFADKNVGTAKTVTVSGYTLAGTDAGNYALVQPAGLSADITAAPLAVTGLAAVSRVYDRTTVAALSGTAAVSPLAGDVLTLAGTATGAFATAGVGTGKAVSVAGLSLAGADSGNYRLVQPTGLSADVTPRALSLAGLAAASRVYDAGTSAAVSGSLAGVLAGDVVSVSLGGAFADANAGSAKPVTVSATLAGADAANYTLAAPPGLSASITPATLRYVAVPTFGTAGQPLPALTGNVSGFLGGDTLATATTGPLGWSTTASAASPTGLYAINGGGLSALNYLFVQDATNATALTLRAAAASDPVTTATTVVTTTALFSVSVPLVMSSPTEGRTLDVTPAFAGSVGAAAERRARTAAAPGREGAPGAATAATPAPGAAAAPTPAATGTAAAAALLPSVAAVVTAAAAESTGGLSFGALDFSRLPRDEVQTLLAARARYKKQVFADGIYRLQQDPTLADVRACRNEAETDSGQCLITEDLKRQIQAAREAARLRAEAAAAAAAAAATAAPGTAAPARPARVQRRVVQAALPVIERKLALLIGVNDYADKAVPQLEGAVRDARAVRERLEQGLGYETTVLESPSRSEIVRAFNRLALEAQPGDSVIVYYAGHGVVVPVDGVDTGFWLPADVDSKKESTWLSNADIGRLIAAIGSRQLMLVSDSCYSGTLVGKDRVSVSGDNPDEWLQRRAAVVMSSGGDEPVADEGKEGHSFFAWHFMRALEGLDRWQVGNNLHERLRTAVSREFPQTPQYGGSRGLGHEGNTDFLFERRQIEAAAKAP